MTVENFLQISWNQIALQSFYSSCLTFILYILPGWTIVTLCFNDQHLNWRERIGLAAALGVAIYPILILWFYLIGIQPGPLLAPVLVILSLLILFFLRRNNKQSRKSLHFTLGSLDIAFIIISGLLVITRIAAIREMIAPAWGDSVHHTLIVQLLLDHWGLFQSWAPYAPMTTFTYHFGFHIVVAMWAFLTGMNAAQSVLLVAQVINVLAILALYPLTTRLTRGNQWAGIFALLVAGLWSSMPAYYVNWGRYTQLTGQVCLPAFLWTLDLYLDSKSVYQRRYLIPMTILVAGIFLIHYRIAVFLVTAGGAWTIVAFIRHRNIMLEWSRRTLGLIVVAVTAGIIILPWEIIINSGKLGEVATSMMERGVNTSQALGDLNAWLSVYSYYSHWLWLIAVVAFIVAAINVVPFVFQLLLWLLLMFLAINPFLLHLPGSGLITNFTLVIAMYIPVAIGTGWLFGEVSSWLLKQGNRRKYVRPLVICLISGLGIWLAIPQLAVTDPFFQMVFPADVLSFRWINVNIQPDAKFLVNGFLSNSSKSTVVGSDAGWWLPYYTKRSITIPPVLYISEQLPPGVDRNTIRQITSDVIDSQGEPDKLHLILCKNNITHIYLGEKQGQVGMGAMPLIRPEWLQSNSDFRLLHQEEQAQIWLFDRSHCSLN